MCRYHLSAIASFLLVSTGAYAQYTDTVATVKQAKSAGAYTGIECKKLNGGSVFTYKSGILPATLIVYGALSLYTDAFQDINETVKEELYTARQPRKTSIDNYLQYTPAAAVYALNLAGVHGKNNFRDRTIIYGISTMITGATVFCIKTVTAETRPDGSNNLSFPSGHTATAFAAAEFLRQEYKDKSPWYGIAGYLAASVTGYLRITNNKHWVGDVMAGAGVGILSTKFAYWIYPSIKKKFFKDSEVHTMIMPSYQDGCTGLSFVHYF